MARTLGYGYLESGFSPPKAVGKWVLVEVVKKDAEKVLESGIVLPQGSLDTDDTKPYFIVRGIGSTAQENLPDLKIGDVIEGGGRSMVSFNGPNDMYLGLATWEDIGVIYSRTGVVDEPSSNKKEPSLTPARPKIITLNG